MTDKIYLLKNNAHSGGTYHGKFFTSPYTAMAKGVRMILDNEELLGGAEFTADMYGIDIDDVPCDHIAIHSFALDILNHIHRSTHEHGFVLLEKSACIYEVLRHGNVLGQVLIIYLPPIPDSEEIGEIVFRRQKGSQELMADLSFMLQKFWDTGC